MTLSEVARALVAPGKGILAADESTGTIKKRFDKIGVENTEDNRQAYRELLFTTPGVGKFISGVILYDETVRQRGSDGKTFVTTLEKQGVISGIKVDMGTEAMPGSPEEKVSKGLEGLPERLKEYKKFDAQFAKWRAVITIGEAVPTDECIAKNAEILATYAKMCQDAGIVPIVEPEVLMDGGHTIERCFEVTTKVLKKVFEELKKQKVDLSGMLLKPNMVIAAKDCSTQASPTQVAEMTLRCFKEVVPTEVPGIVFLSGGQSEQEACENLNAINSLGQQPWQLSFSFGRALQGSALAAWQGKAENVSAGQKAFLHRAELTSAACLGKYRPEME